MKLVPILSIYKIIFARLKLQGPQKCCANFRHAVCCWLSLRGQHLTFSKGPGHAGGSPPLPVPPADALKKPPAKARKAKAAVKPSTRVRRSSKINMPATAAVAEWSTFYDDDGTPYYVNGRTGESQWEKPSCLDDAAAVAAVPETRWYRNVAEDSGQEYFVNETSGESVWVLPEGGIVIPAAVSSTCTSSADDGENLPDGWERVVADDGDVYFYSQNTGESSWTLPEQ